MYCYNGEVAKLLVLQKLDFIAEKSDGIRSISIKIDSPMLNREGS